MFHLNFGFIFTWPLKGNALNMSKKPGNRKDGFKPSARGKAVRINIVPCSRAHTAAARGFEPGTYCLRVQSITH